MAAANFDDFYAQVCALLDLEPVTLELDDSGCRAFTVTYRDAEFSFIELKKRDGDSMSLLVRFGVPPSEKASEVLATLMGANYSMIGKTDAAFAQAPETGDIFLHQVIPLAQVHMPGFPTVLDQFAEQVKSWSRDHFLSGDGQGLGGELIAANLA